MLIRTQDKRSLVDIAGMIVDIAYDGANSKSELRVISNQAGYRHYKPLGTYSTEEKAMEVLDMIQKEYLKPINGYKNIGYIESFYQNKIFVMPADNDVYVDEEVSV